MALHLDTRPTTAPPGKGPADSPGPRLRLLDGMRLLAALAVVLYHYTAWHHEHWGPVSREAFPLLAPLTAFGFLGVQFFFVISGFVILLSAYGRSIPAFIASRVGRLFPAYWAAVLLAGVLVFFIWPAMGSHLTAGDWLVNLSMLQAGFGVPPVDGVYWTLYVELKFYVWIGILMCIGLTRRRMLAFAALWPLAGTLAGLSGVQFFKIALIPEYSPLFAGGIALFLLYKFGHNRLTWAVLLLNVVLAAAQTGVIGVREAPLLVGYDLEAYPFWAATAAIFAAVAVVVFTRLRHIRWRWLGAAGALTYPLYLVHQLWGWWIIENLSPLLPRPLVLAAAVASALALAAVLWLLVDRPCGPRLRRAVARGLARFEHRSPAAPAASGDSQPR